MRRPHEGQLRERVFHSSALLWIPEAIMKKPIRGVTASSARTCRSRLILRRLFPGGGGGNTGTALDSDEKVAEFFITTRLMDKVVLGIFRAFMYLFYP
jgi:hypothetical protein